MDDATFEFYGPMMIRNGFLRDSDGSWINIILTKGLGIRELEAGPHKGDWGIYAIDSDEAYGFVFSFLNFKEKDEAQQFLDHLMNGGIIRLPGNIPVMAGI